MTTSKNTPTVDHATHFLRRTNDFVKNMQFASEVDCFTGEFRADLGVLPARDDDGIVDGFSIVARHASETLPTIDGYDEKMGMYGRNIIVKLDGAGTPIVTVGGLDYLGQPMSETFTLAGTTSQIGKKAFKHVMLISTSVGVASRAIDIGFGNVLGLPFAANFLERQIVDSATPTNGTFVAADKNTPSNATNDPRGTYTPHSSAAPNGSREITLICYADMGDLHGQPQFFS